MPQRSSAARAIVAMRHLVGPIVCSCALPALAQQPAATEVKAPPVQVISTTPLPGIGLPKDTVPANVQTGDAENLRNPSTMTTPQLMERSFDSVNVNEAQGNPYQPDVNFRGFTASPLLGTSPGLSVFQDGVRINEPLGDTVNWDLIPNSAISTITLVPGSNPVFGLNTLGGSIAITTKDGFAFPGLAAQAYAGSFGRAAADIEFGGARDRLGYFVTGNAFYERGWRDNSSSQIRQGFGKLSFRDRDASVDFSLTGADNTLNGSQAIPLSFLQQNREQSYTFPDTFNNQVVMANLVGKYALSPLNLLQGNVYYRGFKSKNFSTNVNDDFDPTLPVDTGNTQGQNVEVDVDTNGWGFGVQYSYLGNLGALKNQLTLGVSLDAARTDFTQSDQEANFAPDRSNLPVGPFSVETQARTDNTYWGLYATDTLSPASWIDITLAGRYNWAEVTIRDLSGTNPALDGNNRFSRFNPAAGVTFKPMPALTAYASYNEGMRVPTPVELTCASPAAPCALPNAFLADPPLDPVIAKTWEFGVRGSITPTVRWHATAYQTTLDNDILFVSASAAAPNTGFFQNVGTTRRRGVELGIGGTVHRLTFAASYSYINAQFRTSFTEFSPSNSSADAVGDIQVQSGNRLPLIPRNILKLRAAYLFGAGFTLGAGMYAQDSQYVRGNENNLDPSGKIAGYAVFVVDARWKFAPDWELFGVINNLFDRKYNSSGVLGTNFFNGPGNTFDATATTREVFYSPAAPLGAWIGIRYAPGARG
ncbi:MAG TPA: TonB-dependent receptor [Burkholderiales bacterium]|nr:TonB-dependent receptor [Burkholderiales bacterium]